MEARVDPPQARLHSGGLRQQSLVGLKEQALWRLEKEELAEEVGGRAPGKVGSG